MQLALLVSSTVLSTLFTVFSLWFMVVGIKAGREIIRVRKERARLSTLRRSISLERRSAISILNVFGVTVEDLATVLTVICVICNGMFQVNTVIIFIYRLLVWIDDQKRADYTRDYRIQISIAVFLYMLSFALSFVCLFQRLKSTFQRSAFKLPGWPSHVVLVLAAIATVMFVVYMFFRNHPIYVPLMLCSLWLVYLFGTLLVLYTFINQILLLLNQMEQEPLSENPLIYAAVKMSVCVSVSLVTSIVDFLIVFGRSLECPAKCPVSLVVIPALISQMDVLINGWALLVTLAKCDSLYRRTLGVFHHCMLGLIVRNHENVPPLHTHVASDSAAQ